MLYEIAELFKGAYEEAIVPSTATYGVTITLPREDIEQKEEFQE